MEIKLSKAIYQAYKEKGVELSAKQVQEKLSDLVEYWADGVIPEMVNEELI